MSTVKVINTELIEPEYVIEINVELVTTFEDVKNQQFWIVHADPTPMLDVNVT